MKKLILITLIAAAALVAFRCNTVRHIHGTVYGSDDKLPIPGATIKVKGSNTATQANGQGKFTLDASDGSSLVISFVGYQSKTVAPGKSDSLDIYLDPSNSQLGEVVVSQSLGTKHSSKTLGYAAATISPADKNAPALSAPVV
ncbi:MAG: carboxypeptidase-like regulatory domain-containing protein, partial [Mucilaginibacter sp.]